MTCPFSRDNSGHGALLCCAFVQYSHLAPLHQVTSYFYIDIKWSFRRLLDVLPSLARERLVFRQDVFYIILRSLLFYVTRMTDKRMRVSLRVAITMTSFSNVKPQYEGFIVKINGRNWTVNIMMFGETALALLAGNEPEE